MDPIPPRPDPPQPIHHGRWWIHLILITSYLLAATVTGLTRNKPNHPALSHTASGLLLVCAVQLAVFGIICVAAWRVSGASRDDLLLRWRGKVQPVLLGAGYSIGLRIGVAVCSGLVAGLLVATHVLTADSLQEIAVKNRPDVETLIDVDAMRHNPAYYWLTLTVVSFVVAGLREELWRSSFLAGLRTLWPRQFASNWGQFGAVVIAAVLFGLAHISMGVLAALMTGLLGLGLGMIMVVHRSVWPAVIAHGFFDATSMALIPWAADIMRHLPAH